jgi:glycerophosphoryl diester phosphodiesterase
VLVLGHRGNRRPGPDNSLAAVRDALDQGAHGVEVDVRRTLDGVLVCSHDADRSGRVIAATPAAELGLARLDDVLDAVRGRGRLVCEIKNVPGEPDFDAPDCAVAALLVALLARRAGRREPDDVVVSSFDWFSLEAVRAAAGPPTAFLTPPGVALSAAVVYASSAGHAEVHAHVQDVLAAGADGVARAHAAGLAVVVWTVTDLGVARRLATSGVDALICDDPAGTVAGLGD